MKSLLLPVLLFVSFSGVPAMAQDSTAVPTETRETNVNVNVPPAPAAAPAPAPDVNVHVDAPASAPAVSTESTTKETSVTKVIETPAAPADNSAMWIAGGCIGLLAIGALFLAARGKT